MTANTSALTSTGLTPTRKRWLAVAVVCVVSAIALLPLAQQAPAPGSMSPEEFALSAYCGPITDRTVVRDGPASLDVWLFSSASFEDTADRIRRAISGRKELPGGVQVGSWTYMEPTRSYWVDLAGTSKARVLLTRHLKGSLLIVQGVGKVSEAPAWTPPYRPLPLDLPHGPVR